MDKTTIWDRIGEKYIYAKYDSDSKSNCEFSWSEIVLGMVKARATQG